MTALQTLCNALQYDQEKFQAVAKQMLSRLKHEADLRKRRNVLNEAWLMIVREFRGPERDEVFDPLVAEETVPNLVDPRILTDLIDRAETHFADRLNVQVDCLRNHWAIADRFIEQADHVPDFPDAEPPQDSDERPHARLRFCLEFDRKKYLKHWYEQVDSIPLFMYGTTLKGANRGSKTLPFLINENASDRSVADVFRKVLFEISTESRADQSLFNKHESVFSALFNSGLTPNSTCLDGQSAFSILFANIGPDTRQSLSPLVDTFLNQELTDATVREFYDVLTENEIDVGNVALQVVEELLSSERLPKEGQLDTLLQSGAPRLVRAINKYTTERQRNYARARGQ